MPTEPMPPGEPAGVRGSRIALAGLLFAGLFLVAWLLLRSSPDFDATDQELRAYYEDHKDEFKVPSRLRIRELVITKGATPAEQEAAKAKVALVKAALAKGAGFEALVREHSEGISRTTGGDLGWMEKGLLRPDLEKAALALQPGQTAGPLESDRDISFIQLIEAQIDGARPFAEVKDKIMEKLQEPKAQNAIEQYMQSLRVRANIRFQVAKDRILQG